MYRQDERIRSHVATLVAARKNKTIKKLFGTTFAPP